MDVFPSFWRLEGKSIIVVGGEDAAARKLRLLMRTPARIEVFSKRPAIAEITDAAAAGKVTLHARAIDALDIPEDAAFAVVATGNDAEAEAAVRLLRHARVPVNAVDRTEMCDFLIPSIVDRSPVVIGIATGGAAPILARSLREQIEAVLPTRLAALADFAGRFRTAVASTICPPKQRKAFWEDFFGGPIARQILDGDEAGATEAMLTTLNGGHAQKAPEGRITLIELPLDQPDLLSLRALRRLQQADLVLHSQEFGDDALDLLRRDADRVAFDATTDVLAQAQDAQKQGLRIAVLALPGTLPETAYETPYESPYETLRHGENTPLVPVAACCAA